MRIELVDGQAGERMLKVNTVRKTCCRSQDHAWCGTWCPLFLVAYKNRDEKTVDVISILCGCHEVVYKNE